MVLIPLSFAGNTGLASTTPQGKSFIELVSETDEVSDLNGFQLIIYTPPSDQSWRSYVGAGLVYITLPEENDSFPALHAIAGADYMITKQLGFNMETGFDLGEHLISGGDGKNLSSVNGEQQNQIDFNVAAGVTIKLDDAAYIKTYLRYHTFDGIYLPNTTKTLFGVKFGFGF